MSARHFTQFKTGLRRLLHFLVGKTAPKRLLCRTPGCSSHPLFRLQTSGGEALITDQNQMAFNLLTAMTTQRGLVAAYTGGLGLGAKRKPYTQPQKSGLTSALWKNDSQTSFETKYWSFYAIQS
jgi:hypothetical protein